MFILQIHPPFCTSLSNLSTSLYFSVPFNTYVMCNYHFPFLILTIPLISLYHAISIDVVGDAIAGQIDLYICMYECGKVSCWFYFFLCFADADWKTIVTIILTKLDNACLQYGWLTVPGRSVVITNTHMTKLEHFDKIRTRSKCNFENKFLAMVFNF